MCQTHHTDPNLQMHRKPIWIFTCTCRMLARSCDANISLARRLEFFPSVVSPVACVASGHRAVHTRHLHKIDVEFRRLLRRLLRPPGGGDWNVHSWNERVQNCRKRLCLENWSTQSLRQYWQFASYVALLPVAVAGSNVL